MANDSEMKKEFLAGVKISNIKDKVIKEIDILSELEDSDGKSFLDKLYKIWKNSKGKMGHENAINSWTAYAIGLTDKKPVEDQPFLPKRRSFARKGFPDIDTDFDYERRNEIYSDIIKTFGQEYVGNIGTYSGMKMRSYIKRSVKALDPIKSFYKHNSSKTIESYARYKGKINKEWETDANAKAVEIINSLPPQHGAFLKVRDENGKEHSIKTVADAYEWCPNFAYYMDQYPEILHHSYNIEGLLSIFGVHPSGIIISDIPLARIAPLRQTKITKQNDAGEDEVVYATQYANEDLEFLGLIKFDVLAISTLSVVARCIKMIKERYDISIDIKDLPIKDEKTFDLYRSGNLIGIFQAEEHGMQKCFVQVGCDRFEDIIAIVSLYRPGPIAMIPEYASRKKEESPVEYFDESFVPFLEPYLSETYGILCIQKDTKIAMADGSHKPISDVKIGDNIVSVNLNSLRIEHKKCLGCAPTSIGKGLKITLRNGFYIIVTKDHKILTRSGMKEAQYITDKDIIACPYKISTLSNNKPIADWLSENKYLCYILGLLLADGNLSCSISVCCGSKNNAILLENWLNKNISKIKTRVYFRTRAWYVSLCCNELVENNKEIGVGNRKTKWHMLLDNINMKNTCFNKRIPVEVFNMPNLEREYLLAGLMDGDGCLTINKNNRSIICNYTSSNDNLLDDVSHLLQTLGISHWRRKNKIHIADSISLWHAISDKLVLKKMPGLVFCSSGRKGDSMPISEIQKKKKYLNVSWRSFDAITNISRHNIRNAIKSKKDYVSGMLSEKLKLVTGDLRYYEIAKIEEIDDQVFYDISVEDNHNLIANGIVVHNCYQESLMQVCQSLAGFSISDGYAIIKAVGKKNESLLQKYENKFINGCGLNGLDKAKASSYWHQRILPFASYGFNKAHACAYAYLSYITAYLKANFPEVFMCCYMNVDINRAKYERVEQLEVEAERMGIEILHRSINKCKMEYEIVVEKDTKSGIMKSQIKPSMLCKGLSRDAASNIVSNQKYQNLRDFAEKTDPTVVDKSSIEALVAAGFFDGDKDKKHVIENFNKIREDIKKAKKKGVDSFDIFG